MPASTPPYQGILTCATSALPAVKRTANLAVAVLATAATVLASSVCDSVMYDRPGDDVVGTSFTTNDAFGLAHDREWVDTA